MNRYGISQRGAHPEDQTHQMMGFNGEMRFLLDIFNFLCGSL